MSNMEYNERDYSVYIGSIDKRVTEEIIYELFLQAGPLEKVTIPKDKETGVPKGFAFATFTSTVSVPYAVDLLDGSALYGQKITVKRQTGGSASLTPNGSTPPGSPSPFMRGTPILSLSGTPRRQNSYEQGLSHQYGRHTPPAHLISQHRNSPTFQGHMRHNSYEDNQSYGQERNTPPAYFTPPQRPQQRLQDFHRTMNQPERRSSRY